MLYTFHIEYILYDYRSIIFYISATKYTSFIIVTIGNIYLVYQHKIDKFWSITGHML